MRRNKFLMTFRDLIVSYQYKDYVIGFNSNRYVVNCEKIEFKTLCFKKDVP